MFADAPTVSLHGYSSTGAVVVGGEVTGAGDVVTEGGGVDGNCVAVVAGTCGATVSEDVAWAEDDGAGLLALWPGEGLTTAR